MRHLVLLTASIASLSLMAGAAGAATAPDAPSVHVSLKGVDLNKPADVETLYAELSRRAREVCNSSGHEVFASDEAERVDMCYGQTLTSVVRQANAPLLTALHAQRGPMIPD